MVKVIAALLAVVLLPGLLALPVAAADKPAYLDTSLSFQKRAEDLVSRMTLDEKIGQTSASAPEIARLGLPSYQWWNECLHGIMGNGFTVFPQVIGLGATWDTSLAHSVGSAISDEARANNNDSISKGKGPVRLDFWSPNINIVRDPRWGRGQETYGEDPYLTSRMSVNYVKGLQGNDPKYLKVVSTPKHFAVHSGPEPLRNRFDARATQRDIWDTYLPAFETCVREGGAYSVMGAYSRINGVPCCDNTWLLGDVLRKKWGFKGYVVSDCGAIENIWQDHKTEKSPQAAAAAAVKAGCDLACGWESYSTLADAVSQGLISEKDIDRSVIRLMEARMRLGMFDPPEMVPYSKIPASVIRSQAHLDLALKEARESQVLLKNRNNLLPLNKSVKTVAVIGPMADIGLFGDYSGTPGKQPVTVLQGIRDKLGSAHVRYAEGCTLAVGAMQPVPSSALTTPDGKPGLQAEYFSNENLSGKPSLVRVDEKVDFNWGEGSPDGLPVDNFSVRWTGKITVPLSGRYGIDAYTDDGARLYLNGKQIVDDWTGHPATTHVTYVELEAGKPYDIKFEYNEYSGQAVAGLRWSPPTDKNLMLDEALECAKSADVAVLVLGTPTRTELRDGNAGIMEDEGTDRSDITLSPAQEQLLKAVCSTGKPVVLVLTGGSTIAVPWAAEHVPAIVESWFGGEFAGAAVADVLFGDYNPGGRLPMTCYKSMDQLPEFTDYSMDNRTYRYFKGEPLYPFGYGLSYTKFGYSGLTLSKKSARAGQNITVSAQVQNAGKKAGDEVVEVYLTDVKASAPVPIRKLVGFQRVSLSPGEKKQVTFEITPKQMAYIDANGSSVLEPGRFKITVGGSQGDAVSRKLGATPVLQGDLLYDGHVFLTRLRGDR